MKDKNRTRESLVSELAELRQRITELEAAEAERQRTEQLLQALNQTALAAGRALTFDEIFAAVAAELHKLGFTCMFLPANEDQSRLFAKYVSFDTGLIKAAEKLVGLKREDFSFPIADVDLYQEVVWRRNTVFVANGEDVMRQLLPQPVKSFAEQLVKILSIPISIATPLIVEDKVAGVLSVHSDALTQDDIPAITAFAHQVAAAWRKAQLFERTQQEITERQRIEETLKRAEREKEIILDSQLEHVIYQDRDHRILWPNQAACASVGMTRQELIGRHCYEIWPQRSERCEDCPVALAMQTGRQHRVEKTTPDGRAWSILGYPVRDATGEINGAIEVTREITDQVQAKQERERLLEHIQGQAHRMRQIVETVPEGLILLDAQKQVALANPPGESHLGTLADARVGDTVTHLGEHSLTALLMPPPTGLWHEVATDREKGPSRVFEVIARSVSESPRGGSATGGWVLLTRDVTQERMIERRAQQQERLAAVGQLAAGIAHDFSNIMATIVLYAQMVARSTDLPSRDQERLATIHQQARQATKLIQQILDFSRSTVLEQQPLDLTPLLKEQVKLLERILPENIEIAFAYGPGEHTVNADPVRIQQAVVNLAVNARDAMPEGGELHFDIERIRVGDGEPGPLPEMQAGEWVQITISDTGTGIPPDVLAHIFDPFFTTKPPGQGSGLGLSQVYGIVTQHEGYIDVKSQVNQGTRFLIYIPALSIPPVEAAALEPPKLARGQGETILVVEDSASARRALVDSLELLNYRVLEAANGRQALALTEQHGADIALILSDVVMPGMSGITLVHNIREQGIQVPVVMVTGHPLKETLENLRGRGISDWLSKPPSLEQLAEAVARALEE
jgi:PAS domain S-box-containing protein